MKRKTYSNDMRELAIEKIKSGMTLTAVSALLNVSVPTLSRWYNRYLKYGYSFVKSPGGDTRSHISEPHVETIVNLALESPLMTIDEIRAHLLESGHSLARSTIWRVLQRNGLTRKRLTAYAAERFREDVLERRDNWLLWMGALWVMTGYRLIFIDEFGVSTKMSRRYGRSLRGTRCVVHIPHGHWHTTTVVAALCPDGILDFKSFTGAMNGERFLNWISELAEKLLPGDILICDNMAAHKVKGIREIVQAKGAEIHYLPPYSPDLNPIEPAISQMKASIKKDAPRNKDNLEDSIKNATMTVTKEHARNYISNSGYPVGAV